MTFAFGGGKPFADLRLLSLRCEIGERDVQLCVFHFHVHPDLPPVLRQSHACLDGIVKQIPDDNAQINLRQPQLYRNIGVGDHVNMLCPCNGNLAVQYCVGHAVAGFDDSIYSSQVLFQRIQIISDGFHISRCGICFHHLNMIPIIMPPSPHLPVHVVHFTVVGFDQIPLIRSDASVDHLTEKPHIFLTVSGLFPGSAAHTSPAAEGLPYCPAEKSLFS